MSECVVCCRSGVDPHKTTCMLYLQADHLFFEKIGSEEACIETMTRHVQRVNNIYRVTGQPPSPPPLLHNAALTHTSKSSLMISPLPIFLNC